jgi:archaellum component FlaG (FlaF/FlaG flagellin family)
VICCRSPLLSFSGAAVALTLALSAAQARADVKLILSTWRIEPSTVKENQPWTVKVWVGNLGSEAPKKPFTVQVLGCDKEYAKCDTVYAAQEVKASGADLAPGKLPGREIVLDIKQGLGKGEHFILVVVDGKRENGEPIRKQVRVPVGFQKF